MYCVCVCTVDGGLEGDDHVGDYPEDSRYHGAETGMVYPPDGVVYGRLLGAPRSPYTINGGVRASAEPLLPSPAMYDEEPPHVQHPAPPTHISPPTPTLPPPPIQNHDNYAHANLLRSPSADSSAPRGVTHCLAFVRCLKYLITIMSHLFMC